MRKDCKIFVPVHVRFNEVDQQGVVWNGHYAAYIEDVLDFLMIRFDLDLEENQFMLRKAVYEYFGSARTADDLDAGVMVSHVGNTSFTFRFEFYRKGEDELLVACDALYVMVDLEEGRPMPITEDMMRMINGVREGL